MKFFVDNCLAPHIARAIDQFLKPQGHCAVHLRDKFKPNTKDEDWISQLAAEGDWVVISGDYHITKKPILKEAWKSSGLAGFFFTKGFAELRPDQQMARIVLLLEDMIDAVEHNKFGNTIMVKGNARGKKDFAAG